MKNILRYLLLSLVVLGFTIPVFGKVEAAKIVILPLANSVEDDELSGQIFFNECMDYFKFPEFDMVDDVVLDKALKEENYAVVGKNGPDEAMLKRIMAKTGADMALMMSLDELSLEPTHMGMREDYYTLIQKCRTMFVNGLTGKVTVHRVNDEDMIEYAVIVRSDYMHDQFRNTVIRELKKVAKI
jgi:hypothetical protein